MCVYIMLAEDLIVSSLSNFVVDDTMPFENIGTRQGALLTAWVLLAADLPILPRPPERNTDYAPDIVLNTGYHIKRISCFE